MVVRGLGNKLLPLPSLRLLRGPDHHPVVLYLLVPNHGQNRLLAHLLLVVINLMGIEMDGIEAGAQQGLSQEVEAEIRLENGIESGAIHEAVAVDRLC